MNWPWCPLSYSHRPRPVLKLRISMRTSHHFSSLFLSIKWNKSLFHSDWSWFQSLTDNILLCILLNFWWSSRTIFLWFKRQIDIIMWIILFDTFEISLWSIPMAISTSYSECFTLDHSYCVDCYSVRGSQTRNFFTDTR